jgi:hypothetical protein
MATDSQDHERRHHIDGFVNSFVDSKRRERYRSFLLNPKKRSKITDKLNHTVDSDLIVKHIVAKPPRYSSKAIAYLISDQRELDDSFIEAAKAMELVESAYFATIASIIPGVLIALRMESPAPVLWLYRRELK